MTSIKGSAQTFSLVQHSGAGLEIYCTFHFLDGLMRATTHQTLLMPPLHGKGCVLHVGNKDSHLHIMGPYCVHILHIVFITPVNFFLSQFLNIGNCLIQS